MGHVRVDVCHAKDFRVKMTLLAARASQCETFASIFGPRSSLSFFLEDISQFILINRKGKEDQVCRSQFGSNKFAA